MPNSKQKYDPILDSIAEGVFTVENDWNIMSFNRAAEQITGVARDNAIGKKCWEVFHEEIWHRRIEFCKGTFYERYLSVRHFT